MKRAVTGLSGATSSRVTAPTAPRDQTRKLIIGVFSWLMMAVTGLALIAGGYLLWRQVVSAPVAQVHVVSEHLSAQRQQMLTQRLQPLVEKGYFTADLTELRDEALRMPWVEQVTVTRAWPNGIAVRPISRQAVARWGTSRWLSDRGVVFTQPDGGDYRLPMLHGPETQSMAMMSMFQRINSLFAPLHLRVNDLYLTDRMTWFIELDNGLRIIVDQNQTEQKLQRFAVLLQKRLRKQLPLLAVADLRYVDGLAVLLKQKQVAAAQAALASQEKAETTASKKPPRETAKSSSTRRDVSAARTERTTP